MIWAITPSAFHNDPLGHVINQSGHMAMGYGAGAAMQRAGVPWWAALFMAVSLYAMLIEAPQIRRGGRHVIGDSIEDALHFAFGVLMGYAFAWWAAVVWLLALARGAYLRT